MQLLCKAGGMIHCTSMTTFSSPPPPPPAPSLLPCATLQQCCVLPVLACWVSRICRHLLCCQCCPAASAPHLLLANLLLLLLACCCYPPPCRWTTWSPATGMQPATSCCWWPATTRAQPPFSHCRRQPHGRGSCRQALTLCVRLRLCCKGAMTVWCGRCSASAVRRRLVVCCVCLLGRMQG
jgi:hypothetical protein